MYKRAIAASMRKDLAEIVCCPVHKTSLDLKVRKRDDVGDILEGTLRCAKCDFDYPIEEGIPNLLPPSYHVDEVKEAKPAKSTPSKAAKTAAKATKSSKAKASKATKTTASPKVAKKA